MNKYLSCSDENFFYSGELPVKWIEWLKILTTIRRDSWVRVDNLREYLVYLSEEQIIAIEKLEKCDIAAPSLLSRYGTWGITIHKKEEYWLLSRYSFDRLPEWMANLILNPGKVIEIDDPQKCLSHLTENEISHFMEIAADENSFNNGNSCKIAAPPLLRRHLIEIISIFKKNGNWLLKGIYISAKSDMSGYKSDKLYHWGESLMRDEAIHYAEINWPKLLRITPRFLKDEQYSLGGHKLNQYYRPAFLYWIGKLKSSTIQITSHHTLLMGEFYTDFGRIIGNVSHCVYDGQGLMSDNCRGCGRKFQDDGCSSYGAYPISEHVHKYIVTHTDEIKDYYHIEEMIVPSIQK